MRTLVHRAGQQRPRSRRTRCAALWPAAPMTRARRVACRRCTSRGPAIGVRVGQAVGEAERVVDVVDVAARDAEVLLDLLRVQRERVDDEVAACRARSGRRSRAGART